MRAHVSAEQLPSDQRDVKKNKSLSAVEHTKYTLEKGRMQIWTT